MASTKSSMNRKVLSTIADAANWTPKTSKRNEEVILIVDIKERTGKEATWDENGDFMLAGKKHTIEDVPYATLKPVAMQLWKEQRDAQKKSESQVGGSISQQMDPNTTQSVAGKKRKNDDTGVDNVDLDEIDCEGMHIDQNCDQVRRRIRRFLDSDAMKVGEFCSAIGVSNKSLNDFLRQSGPMKGSGSATYDSAWEFFKKRDIAGMKMPNKKQKAVLEGSTKSTSSSQATKSTGIDISAVHLPGEESDGVPVFESCDEVRRKITAHLKKPGVTQAQFCRDLHAQLHSADAPVSIQSSQLGRFRDNKGAKAGNTSSVFYAAFVYFERVRIAEGRKKSKHREEMEGIWAWRGGVDRVHSGRHGYWCKGKERPREDKYGRVFFH